MAKKEFKNTKDLQKAMLKDWKDQSEAHLSQFINSVASDLVDVSPVDSGFFASSWQANTYRPLSNEERTPPWTQVKKDRDNGIITLNASFDDDYQYSDNLKTIRRIEGPCSRILI